MSNLIIYGAGTRSLAAICRAESITGLKSVALCDTDPAKIGRNIHGLPVLSKQTVTDRYKQDFLLYISPNFPARAEIQESLLKENFVQREKIVNYANYHIVKSCDSIEQLLVFDDKSANFCCRGLAGSVPYQENISATVESILLAKEQLARSLVNLTETHPCYGCPMLKEAHWEIDRKVRTVSVFFSYPCQLSCVYCNNNKNAKHKNQMKNFPSALPDIAEFLAELGRCGKLALEEPIQVNGGEPTLMPLKDKKQIFAMLNDYPLQIFTNGVIYDELIANAITRPGSFLNVSLDSGTQETYCKVKGLDVFNRVTENLRRYRDKGNLALKYILLPENIGENDLNGFINLAAELRVDKVMLSRNMNVEIDDISPQILAAAIYMIKECRHRGIPLQILDYWGDKLNHITGDD